MSLLPSELARLKYELGYNFLNVGAEPYVGVVALFEQVIQPFLQSGASTTTSSGITSSGELSLATLTLDDVTGFAAGAVAIVDVDSFQERATIRSVSGSTIQLFLLKGHAGTYPVTVEGGESIIRAILQRIQAIAGLSGENGEAGAMGGALGTAGIKRIDDIEFFGGVGTATQMADLMRQREYWRDELASALGIERLNGGQGSGGSSVAMY